MNYLIKKVFNPELHEKHRKMVVEYRTGAISNAFVELDGIINDAALARDYFDKSPEWFAQKLKDTHLCRNATAFDSSEARHLADAFRDIARRLTGLAAEIDAVADVD